MKTFVLKPETLPSFRQIVDYRVSLSSIFQYGDSAGLSEVQVQDLIKQGVLDKNGAIAEDAKLAIETLATADRFCRVRFAGGKDIMESINYFSQLTNTIVSVTNREDGFYVNVPQNGDDIIIGIEQFVGDSVLRSFDFEVKLDETATAVFLAIVDLCRQKTLSGIASNKPYERPLVLEEEIKKHLETPSDTVQWLTNLYLSLVERPLNPQVIDFSETFNRLKDHGLLVAKDQGYQLSGEAIGFENQFLITENVIRVDIGQEKEGRVFNSGFTVVQGGINDLIYIDYNGETAQLEAISSSRVIEYLDLFMNRLNLVNIALEDRAMGSVTAHPLNEESLPTEERQFCTECGALLNSGARFCHQCGQSIKTTEELKCPQCSEPVEDDMMFCINCGHKLK